MRVLRVDEVLASLDAPKVNAIENVLIAPDDAVVVCAGFEERSLGVLQSLHSVARPRVILVEYRPVLLGNRLEECLSECRRIDVTPLRYVYDRENPAGAGSEIWSLLHGISGRVFIDVSGMSRLLIVQLLGSCMSQPTSSKVTVLYTEPEHYYPIQEQLAGAQGKASRSRVEFLSWGVSEITVVPELSSVALPEQPTHLIAFPSYDGQQLAAVRKDVEPARISLIFGMPLPEHGKWRLEAVRGLNYRRTQRNVAEYVTSTYDYRETLHLLLQLYSAGQRLEKIVISPTGSKMQTIAVGITKAFLRDVKVVYPTPGSFATEAYTTGIRRMHELPLDAFWPTSCS
ncbi:MAG: hypothetical protein ABSG32_31150 [Terriglobia bacterium]